MLSDPTLGLHSSPYTILYVHSCIAGLCGCVQQGYEAKEQQCQYSYSTTSPTCIYFPSPIVPVQYSTTLPTILPISLQCQDCYQEPHSEATTNISNTSNPTASDGEVTIIMLHICKKFASFRVNIFGMKF